MAQTIEELAYFKWEAAGRPLSDGVEFWLAAEAELEASSTPPKTCEKPLAQPPRKVAAKATNKRK
jgi:hypothetical protein